MIYEDYEAIWSKIKKQEKKLINLINKRDELFEKTQPKTSQYDKEVVDGKKQTNIQEQYVIQQEYLTEKINQLNTSLDDLYQILKRKREELKLSKNIYDRIYYYREIEKLNMYKIASLVGYSREQTYRYYRKIKMTQNDKQNNV